MICQKAGVVQLVRYLAQEGDIHWGDEILAVEGHKYVYLTQPSDNLFPHRVSKRGNSREESIFLRYA